jgi:hypothetical protein
MNGMLTDSIKLQHSIWRGFLLFGDIYMSVANALGYLLEDVKM